MGTHVHSLEIGEVKKAFFVGDVHLDPRAPDREQRFIKFLDYVRSEKPAVLFLMGDIFEFWYGYYHVMFTHHIKVISKLACLRFEGIKIVYIVGNHDFLPGPVFSKYLNFIVALDPFIIKMGDKNVYLSHGDEVNTEDRGYIFLKKIIRNSLAQKFFKLVPASWAWLLGRITSDTSRKLKHFREEISPEVYRNFFDKCAAENVDVIIHGHTHKAEERKIEFTEKTMQFINSGDWFGSGAYVIYENDDFKLKEFK